MAKQIVKHHWNEFDIRQRVADGFVNLTDMCRAGDRRVGDFLDLPTTKAYITALAEDLGALPDFLVTVKRGGRDGGSTFAHPEIAIECARWVNMQFHIWANRTLRHIIQQSYTPSNRILDIPKPGSPIFEDWFEQQIQTLNGLHKNDIRNGKFYWEFVYCWLTEAERAHLNRVNPVLSNGRRKYKIHDCLTAETKERLIPLQYKLMGKMESCQSIEELRRMFQRTNGIDQPNLFDGIWQSIGLLPEREN